MKSLFLCKVTQISRDCCHLTHLPLEGSFWKRVTVLLCRLCFRVNREWRAIFFFIYFILIDCVPCNSLFHEEHAYKICFFSQNAYLLFSSVSFLFYVNSLNDISISSAGKAIFIFFESHTVHFFTSGFAVSIPASSASYPTAKINRKHSWPKSHFFPPSLSLCLIIHHTQTTEPNKTQTDACALVTQAAVLPLFVSSWWYPRPLTTWIFMIWLLLPE